MDAKRWRQAVTGLGLALLVAAPGRAWAAAEVHSRAMSTPFTSPKAVTEKCLECHKTVATELMRTSHWRWLGLQSLPGQGAVDFGKKVAVSSLCLAIPSNWGACAACHPSYGWTDGRFAFDQPSAVDCLICHDDTGTYRKGIGGLPEGFGPGSKPGEAAVDLLAVARSVVKPTRRNCGICHFGAGGFDNAKHGDLGADLLEPSRDLDVHMSSELGFTCQTCHKASLHDIKGNAMAVSPGGGNRLDCPDCHEMAPHRSGRLNRHTSAVACQTCHIPLFARRTATITRVDWSTAGQAKEAETDAAGRPLYDKEKGTLVWEENVAPVYAWFNRKAHVTRVGDKIDAARPAQLTAPLGAIDEPEARIFPFKRLTARQPLDVKNGYLAIPKLAGEGSLAATGDWQRALKEGMKGAGLAFGGEVEFVETSMLYRINHMVPPAKQALKCADCHKKDGRMDWQALGYPSQGPYPKARAGAKGKPAAQ
ncbi:MAG: tetrathionate reductase family octaheme c-type cytochrome [Thermodesulfobacteriota bacterium]